MRLLPFERLTLRSDDPPEVVEAKLMTLVSKTRWFSLVRQPEPFRGSIEREHFKLVRVLGAVLGLTAHNPFRPVIVGLIAPAPGGTEVRARMRLSALVSAFMAFWFGVLLWIAGMLLRFGLTKGFGPYTSYDGTKVVGAGFGLAVVGAMGFAVYSLVSMSFWTEVKKARSAMRDGLGCHEVESRNRPARR